MAEYWKSTPRYWCKFCEIFVRDTGIERKNHEASAKHQNSIQRSLRGLHKDQEKQQRDQQRAKSEVARLNGLVGTKAATTPKAENAVFKPRAPAVATGPVDLAAHRKAQAQQLIAMGMQVPDDLKESVSGVGSWKTVSERVLETDGPSHLKVELATTPEARVKGVHKRKAEDDDDEAAEEQPTSIRKNWGSTIRTYPGRTNEAVDDQGLDALLVGVSKKKSQSADATDTLLSISEGHTSATEDGIKSEIQPQASSVDDVKHEDEETAVTAPPVVAFKKRKGKR